MDIIQGYVYAPHSLDSELLKFLKNKIDDSI
jgi:hypothetical protein